MQLQLTSINHGSHQRKLRALAALPELRLSLPSCRQCTGLRHSSKLW
jgi:hypothetical protein